MHSQGTGTVVCTQCGVRTRLPARVAISNVLSCELYVCGLCQRDVTCVELCVLQLGISTLRMYHATIAHVTLAVHTTSKF